MFWIREITAAFDARTYPISFIRNRPLPRQEQAKAKWPKKSDIGGVSDASS